MKTDITFVILRAIWSAFKWPGLCFLVFMLLRLFIGPIWRAITRGMNR